METFKEKINKMMTKKTLFIVAIALCMGLSATATYKSFQTEKNVSQTFPVTSNVSGVPATPVVDLTYAAEKAVNSVVYIKVTIQGQQRTMTYSDPFEDFFGDFFGRGQSQPQQRTYKEPDRKGAGSGVILSADGYIVTNNHVVDNASEIMVKLNDNREFKGRIIGTDANSDLALIKIEAKNLQPITIGNSDELKLGEWVLAIGNPYSLTSTVTAGIVSAKARTTGSLNVESAIQTDAAINPGNSGGALVNARGELVGINNMIYSQTGSYAGYGFAIPVTIVKKVVADLKEYGVVQRALIGIAGSDVSTFIEQKEEKGEKVDLGTNNGIYVGQVTDDGAAKAAGLKEGDVITEIDGKKVTRFGELQELLSTHKPGDKVTVKYLRDKKAHTASLTLQNAQGTTSAIEKMSNDDLGIALRKLTNDEKDELALSYGLIVSAVKDGKMKDAGITKGLILMQVNDRRLNDVEDFEAAVKEANMSSDRVLWIRAKTQSGYNKSFTVDLSDTKKKK